MSNLFEKKISHMAQRIQNQAQEQQHQHQLQQQLPSRQALSLWRARLQKNNEPPDESGGIPPFSTITTTTTASSAASLEEPNRGSSPSSSTTLWRSPLSAASSLSSAKKNRPQVTPIYDVKDVSHLRAAFLKCANRERSADAAAEATHA